MVSIEEALRETFYCSRVRRGMSEEEICKRQFISIEQSPYILMIDVAGSHHLKISQFFELTDGESYDIFSDPTTVRSISTLLLF